MNFLMKKKVSFIFIAAMVAGCAKHPELTYSPSDWREPARTITQTVVPTLPSAPVKASFGVGNNPAIVKAYYEFIKNGVSRTVSSDTLRTVAYDVYAHPLLACSPLHLCVVQLEEGERINDIELGDASHWVWARSFVGTPNRGSYQVSIKPKQENLATDLLITTDKRTYNIGLVSQLGLPSQILTFYYPQETHTQDLITWHKNNADASSMIDSSENVANSIQNLNFHYRLGGDHPIWHPARVFDNGSKTFIEMPEAAEHFNLPVLYLYRHHQMQLVNYRYQRPYYIIDGLFETAYLISGVGSHQDRVIIYNEHLKG